MVESTLLVSETCLRPIIGAKCKNTFFELISKNGTSFLQNIGIQDDTNANWSRSRKDVARQTECVEANDRNGIPFSF